MIADYEISLGRLGDIPSILALQETNLVGRGGSLSVRQTADWFRQAIVEKSLVVGRHDQKVVGYVSGTSLAANTHVMIIQTMLRDFPPPPDCYLYGPVCVAETERGKRACWCSFRSAAKAHGWAPRNDFHTSRQYCFTTSAPENGDERTRNLHTRRRSSYRPKL
jgi:hypothetical protein